MRDRRINPKTTPNICEQINKAKLTCLERSLAELKLAVAMFEVAGALSIYNGVKKVKPKRFSRKARPNKYKKTKKNPPKKQNVTKQDESWLSFVKKFGCK